MSANVRPEHVSPPDAPLPGIGMAPVLYDTGVHVWSVPLRHEPSAGDALFRILSRDERRRAEGFVFERDRSRFIRTRGALRIILGGYLAMHADRIRFRYDLYGKPRLDVGTEGDRLGFNVSHSRGMALVAVARRRCVGIDIEYVDKHRPYLDIAATCFSPLEMKNLHRLPESLRLTAFFNCWTRKEAYIKAIGKGFSYPLQEFTVPITSAEPGTVLSIADPRASRPWLLLPLRICPGFSAALVTEGERDCAPKFYCMGELKEEGEA
jgi:4'-phosphopantetheinyl transferase